MSRKGGLGSGLDALFGVSDEPEQIANSKEVIEAYLGRGDN